MELDGKAGRKANALTWVGLGLMSVQFGVLARLTWWEYSWDVSEFVPLSISFLLHEFFNYYRQYCRSGGFETRVSVIYFASMSTLQLRSFT